MRNFVGQSISVLIIIGCIVSCMFFVSMFFGFFKEYGYVSLYEPEYFCFKILGRGLKGLCSLREMMVRELVP